MEESFVVETEETTVVESVAKTSEVEKDKGGSVVVAVDASTNFLFSYIFIILSNSESLVALGVLSRQTCAGSNPSNL